MSEMKNHAGKPGLFGKTAPAAVLVIALALVALTVVPALNPINPFKNLGALSPQLDSAGNPVLYGQVDASGKPVMEPVLDSNGNPVTETVMQQATGPLADENGDPVLDENGNQETGPLFTQQLDDGGNPVTDDSGAPVMVPVMEPVMVPETDDSGAPVMEDHLDGDGQPVYVQQTDSAGAPVLDGSGNPVMVVEQVPVMVPETQEVTEQVMLEQFDPSAVARWKPMTLIAGKNADVTVFADISKTVEKSLVWDSINGSGVTRLLGQYKNNVSNTVIATFFALFSTASRVMCIAGVLTVLAAVCSLLFKNRRWITGACILASAAAFIYGSLGFLAVWRLNREIPRVFANEASKYMLSLDDYAAKQQVSFDGFSLAQPPWIFVFIGLSLAALVISAIWMAGRMKDDTAAVSLKAKNRRYGYVFTAPLWIGFFVIFIVILYNSAIYSFNSVNIQTNTLTPVGLANYNIALRVDPAFVRSVGAQASQLLPNLLITVIFSMVIANILNQKMAGRAFFRAIFFVPVILATGILSHADLSNYLMNKNAMDMGAVTGSGGVFQTLSILQGILGNVLNKSQTAANFLGSAFNGVYNIVTKSGVQILLFLASIQSISPSIYEAAEIEGASAWECFWKVTFPMLAPAIIVNAVYTVIDALVNADNSIMTSIYAKAFSETNFGVAGAMAWFYFAAVILYVGATYLVLTLLFRKQLA